MSDCWWVNASELGGDLATPRICGLRITGITDGDFTEQERFLRFTCTTGSTRRFRPEPPTASARARGARASVELKE